MRMRKKKWADPYIEAHKEYALKDPIEYKGNWHKLLNSQILHVEIGTGKGDYLNRMAELYPEEAWVGIEKEHNVAAIACRKAIEMDGANLQKKRMIIGCAEDMERWFDEKEIDFIHLNFSDPWPKKHSHKKRLSSDRFLKMYHHLLNNNGQIRMKTDNKELFEDSIIYFLHNGFTLNEVSVDYRRTEHPEDAITEYEQRFMDLGQPIYQLCAAICSNE